MKLISGLVVISIYLIASCQNSTEPAALTASAGPATKWMNDNPAKIANVDTIISQINAEIGKSKGQMEVQVAILSPEDVLEYPTLPNGLERISVKMYRPGSDVWPTFYLKNGEVVLMRYREWSSFPLWSVKEEFMYIENGQVFFAREHQQYLKPGEMPVMLRLVDELPSTQPKVVLQEKFDWYWQRVKKVCDQEIKNKK